MGVVSVVFMVLVVLTVLLLLLLVVAGWETVSRVPLVGEELVDQTFRLVVGGCWFPAEVRGDRFAGHEGALAAIGARIFKHDLGHLVLSQTRSKEDCFVAWWFPTSTSIRSSSLADQCVSSS